MAQGILAGFLSGFAQVGSAIAEKEAEKKLEADSAIALYQKQQDILYKAKRQAKDEDAIRQANNLRQIFPGLTGMSPAGLQQTDALFGTTDPTQLSDGSDIGGDVEVQDAVTPTGAPEAMTSPMPEGYTQDQIMSVYSTLSDKQRNDPLLGVLMKTKLQENYGSGGKLDLRRRQVEVAEQRLDWEMGKEDQAKAPFFENNAPVILLDLESRGLPASEKFIAASAKKMTQEQYYTALAKQQAPYNQGKYVEAAQQAESVVSSIQNAYDLAAQTETGPLSGSGPMVFFEQMTGGQDLATFKAQLAPLIAAVPRTPGSISDFEAKALESALAKLGNSKEANVEIMKNIMNASLRLREAMRFEQSMASSVLVDKGAIKAAFSKYMDANPFFQRDKSGLLVENQNRLEMDQWDWDANKPREGVIEDKVDNKLNSTFSVTPQEDKLLDTFKN